MPIIELLCYCTLKKDQIDATLFCRVCQLLQPKQGSLAPLEKPREEILLQWLHLIQPGKQDSHAPLEKPREEPLLQWL